jgi:hypothetical protein
MSAGNPLVHTLLALTEDALFGSRWHAIVPATEGLTDDMLDWEPAPPSGERWSTDPGTQGILTIRSGLGHLIDVTRSGADALGPRSDDAVEAEWGSLCAAPAAGASGLIASCEAVSRVALARARGLTDAALYDPSVGDDPELRALGNVFALASLVAHHTPWHLGQAALLIEWHNRADAEPFARPKGPPTHRVAPCAPRPWAFPRVTTPAELCVALLDLAFSGCPWHAVTHVLEQLTPDEATWTPLATATNATPSLTAVMEHLAYCKVMYANHGFGDASLDWPDIHPLIAPPPWGADPEQWTEPMRRAQEYLVDHILAAPERLSTTQRMHHGVMMTGLEVVATMFEHDAWHAAQASILREAYAALA